MMWPKYALGLIQVCLLLRFSEAAPTTNDEGLSPIVETTKGKVQGLKDDFKGQSFEAFKGIPYAQPPVGKLRWERPSEPSSWKGVRPSLNYSIPCTQIRSDVSGEDCLYLNVFVPGGVKVAKSLPVMVFAHGGGFFAGTGAKYNGQELAITGKVILVTFNYRLSALGGLATRDASAQGNYQLWDARAVLLWVRDNIKNFGGDPSRVTAFGQSAGAALVSHLAISPLTKGLLHRVIPISGNAASTFGIQYKSRKNAQNLASYEDCPVKDTRAMVECLRGKDAHDVDISGLVSLVVEGGVLPGWLPAVDGIMVPDMPKEMWRKGAASHVDFMVGRLEDDAAGFIYLNLRGEPTNFTLNLAEDKEFLNFIMTFMVQSYAPGDPQDLVNIISQKYPDIKSDDILTRTKAASQITTDWIFTSPTHYEAVAHARNAKSQGKKTYLFNFKHRASFLHHASWITASHSDELHFLFGEPYRTKFRREKLGEFSPLDEKVKANTIHYFTNFAYSGDPNKGPHQVPAVWPEYSESSGQYLEMNATMNVHKEDPALLSRINFWLKEWPKITVPESP